LAKEAIQQKIKIVPNQTRIFGKIQTVSFLAKPENLSYSSFVIFHSSRSFVRSKTIFINYFLNNKFF
jgi:hypothetical protein